MTMLQILALGDDFAGPDSFGRSGVANRGLVSSRNSFYVACGEHSAHGIRDLLAILRMKLMETLSRIFQRVSGGRPAGRAAVGRRVSPSVSIWLISWVSFLALTVDTKAGFLEDIFGPDDTPADARAGAPPAKGHRSQAGDQSGRQPPGDRRWRSRSGFDVRLNDEQRDFKRAKASSTPVAESRSPDEPTRENRRMRPKLCYPDDVKAASREKVDALLHDPTLRAGDSVVTADGVRVFLGRSACPHSLNDFVSLSAAHQLSRVQRNTLIAIEQAMKVRKGSDVLTVQEANASAAGSP
jgi:hypothetical protein